MKMISRRSFMAVAGAATAAVALTACGGSSSSTSTASSTASSPASSEAASTSAAAAELTTVEAGKLTMATNATFPPYEMTDDSGNVVGIDAEIAGAQAEGCEVLELTAPLAIETGEDGHVSGLRVQPQIIGEPRRGRPAPRAAATPEQVIPCERVFVAIGHDIDSRPFEEMGIACKWGCIVTDSDGAVPNFDGLFSGGDCQTGPATVIRAINAGRVASANIDRCLGFDHKIKLDVELPTVQFKGKHECGRCELGEREAGERIHDWDLVEQGLTEQEARQEASRCLRCDHFGFGAFRGGRNLEW